MTAITSQWCRHLVNAYEVKAGVVSLQRQKLCDPYMSASEACGAIQISLPLLSYLSPLPRTKAKADCIHESPIMLLNCEMIVLSVGLHST